MDGKVLNESSAIAKLLAAKHGYYPADLETQFEIDVVTNQVDDFIGVAASTLWVLKGEEKVKSLQGLREGAASKLFRLLNDRIQEKENKNYLVGDKMTLADFRVFSFYQMVIREIEPETFGSLLVNFPEVFRYLQW